MCPVGNTTGKSFKKILLRRLEHFAMNWKPFPKKLGFGVFFSNIGIKLLHCHGNKVRNSKRFTKCFSNILSTGVDALVKGDEIAEIVDVIRLVSLSIGSMAAGDVRAQCAYMSA